MRTSRFNLVILFISLMIISGICSFYISNKSQPTTDTKTVAASPTQTTTSTTSDNGPEVGFFIKSITFHEGFRPPGLKALDVQLIARGSTPEYLLVRGRDEIVEAVGTTGKVYNMAGSKGTGVTLDFQHGLYFEYQIIQYTDVDVAEKNITSVVLRHDGKNITIKVKGITPVVTHA